MPDDVTEILAGIACAAEKAALSHFMSATAAYMQEHPSEDGILAEVFARAFATGLMMAAVGVLRAGGASLSEAEEILRGVIGSEVFADSSGEG